MSVLCFVAMYKKNEGNKATNHTKTEEIEKSHVIKLIAYLECSLPGLSICILRIK
jgi:hypothetical protein